MTSLLAPALLSIAGAAAFHPAEAFAQWSGSVAAVSEYRFRGTDLGDGKPSMQAGVAYDAQGGWYAGAFGAYTRLAGRGGAQAVLYAGHARRLAGGLALDAGISVARVTQDGYGNYEELYAGVSRAGADGGVSARLSWSPRYRYGGNDARTLYCEADAGTALTERFDAFIHAGTLVTLSGPRLPQRSDLRAGISMRAGAFGVQLAYVRNNHRAAYSSPYRYGPEPSRHAVVVSVSREF